MLCIDSVRSGAYQTPKTMASMTAKTAVLSARGTARLSVRMSVYSVPATLSTTTVSQYTVGTYRLSCNWTANTRPSTIVKMMAVALRPVPRPTLTQSAKLSPTVVHRILMIQNHTVTSGTLLSMVRWGRATGGLAVLVIGPERRGTPLNTR